MKLVTAILMMLFLAQPVAAEEEWSDQVETLYNSLEMAEEGLSQIDCSEPDQVPDQDASCETTRVSLHAQVKKMLDHFAISAADSLPIAPRSIEDARDLVTRYFQFVGD